jgi:hypothetical protein
MVAAGSTGDSRPPGALVTQVYMISGALPAATDALGSSPASPVDALVAAVNRELAAWDLETPEFERRLRTGLSQLTASVGNLLHDLAGHLRAGRGNGVRLVEFADWVYDGFGTATPEPARDEWMSGDDDPDFL